jgi:hypothetical protein
MHVDSVEIGLGSLLGLTAVIWAVLEVRRPMSTKARSVMMWIALIEIAVLTFWSTRHGTYFY